MVAILGRGIPIHVLQVARILLILLREILLELELLATTTHHKVGGGLRVRWGVREMRRDKLALRLSLRKEEALVMRCLRHVETLPGL